MLVPGTSTLQSAINPALALMLFATFMQVPLASVGSALRDLRFIVALVLTNFVLLPLLVAGLIQFAPDDPMLKLAVLMVLLAPCVDYVITFTHLGGGNARLLLAMTPLLLGLQMLLLPAYIWTMLGDEAAAMLRAEPFLHAFVWLIGLPLLAAAALQQLRRRTVAGTTWTPFVDLLPVPATALVLFIVVASVMPQVGQSHSAALTAWPIYGTYGVLAPLVAWVVARALRLASPAGRALGFSAAYRNSLVILPLSFAVPGGVPLVPAVILTQTITELLFLPLYLRMMPRVFRSA